MRILIIGTSASKINNFPSNNYNEQETGMIRAFTKLGHVCDVAFYSDIKEDSRVVDIDGINVNVYYFKGIDVLKSVRYKDYRHLYDKYDILLPISYDHYETYHIAMMYPEKTVVYNGTYYAKFNKRYNFKCAVFDRFILPGYRKKGIMFATKNNLSAEFLNKKGLLDTTVVGVGLDITQLNRNKEPKESDLYNLLKNERSDGTKILLYIGKIEPRRNTIFLIDLFNEVQRMGKVKLVIIGTGKDVYKGECIKKIKEYNLQDKIIYVERLEQEYLPLIYRNSDVFLLPTSYEIFGMVILEAMYFGAPVITTLNGGSDILIENGINGYIIEELDINKWATCIKQVINSDNDALKLKAHEKIVNEFTWDKLALKFLKVFNSRLSVNTEKKL